jgi:hypothetical protein
MLLKKVGCVHYSTCLDRAIEIDKPVDCCGCTYFEKEDLTKDETFMQNIRSCVLFLHIWPELATIHDPTSHEALMRFLRYGERDRETT